MSLRLTSEFRANDLSDDPIAPLLPLFRASLRNYFCLVSFFHRFGRM